MYKNHPVSMYLCAFNEIMYSLVLFPSKKQLCFQANVFRLKNLTVEQLNIKLKCHSERREKSLYSIKLGDSSSLSFLRMTYFYYINDIDFRAGLLFTFILSLRKTLLWLLLYRFLLQIPVG